MKFGPEIMLFLMLPILLPTQEFSFPQDTSFSVASAYRKIKKDFPQASPVKIFKNTGIQEERNVVYCFTGKRNLHTDLFYPKKTSKKTPAVILIHGGGWASGNKSHLVPLAQKLAENGFLSATVEYRLSPEAKYPAGVNDLKTAVKWLKFNAEKYNIDTSRVASLGTSSGATLATLIGTTAGNPRFQPTEDYPGISDKIQAIINIDGIVDFTDPAESGKDDDPQKPSAGARWFGSTFKQNPDVWIEASPINYVDENTPPTLFINSALTRFHAGRDQYLEILKQNNTKHKITTIPKTPHPFWLFHPWFEQTYLEIISFLHQTL